MQQKHGAGVTASLDMLDVFESVGVQFCDLTHTNADEEKRGFRSKQTLQQARASMPYLVPSSERRRNNVIIRPHHPPAAVLLQLDDLTAGNLERVRPFAFMVVATSPGNFQAWLAVESAGIEDRKDFARRVRKATGADPTASGAVRVAGTANYKRKYEPDFPVIAIDLAQPGRTVSPAALQTAGLIVAPEKSAPAKILPRRHGGRKWPSYKFCVDHAPKAHNADRPDISRADFTFCMTAIDWGFTVEATAARLLEESGKARENGQPYAMETARNAAAAVQRRRAGPEP
jgi:hypothetical protein